MTAFVDTSVLVRYLTLDPPDHGARAQALIDSSEELSISAVALAETAFVLTKLYAVDSAVAVDLLVELLGRANLSTSDIPKSTAAEALLLCRSSRRVSFSDALIWASARASGPGVVYTFDQRFPETGIERRLL